MIEIHNPDNDDHESQKSGDSSPEPSHENKANNVVSLSDLRKKEKEKAKKRTQSRPQQYSKEQNYGAVKPSVHGAHPPMINLPFMTKILLILNVGIFGLMLITTDNQKHDIFSYFGFIPAHFTGLSSTPPAYFWQYIITPFSYMFLHSGWLHIIMNCAMLAAFGAGVEKWMGQKKMLSFYILCGLGGALGQLAIYPASVTPVVGASGALSGLFAAVIIMLARAGQIPQGRFGMWPFVALWVGLPFVFEAFNGFSSAGPIAWAAHLGGFLAGMGLVKHPYFQR